MKLLAIVVLTVSLLSAVARAETDSSVPGQLQFSGIITEGSGAHGVTFALYPEQAGGIALWMETQNVSASDSGSYSVLLGSETPGGIPQSIFASGEARWLEVSYAASDGSLITQPRVLLVSVPYAMKAGDAETLGGLPASAFVLQLEALKDHVLQAGGLAVNDGLPTAAVSGTGTTNRVTKWLDAVGTLGDSSIFDTGTLVGIGTNLPGAALHVDSNNAAFILSGTGTHSFSLQGALSNGRFGQDSEGVFFASDTSGKAFKFLTNNGALNENMRIASNGFVGIGTNLPGATLDIQQDNASVIIRGTGTHSLSLQGALSNGRFGQDSEGMFFASDTNGRAFKFLTNNGALNEWMRITSTGNVGIGITLPTQRLHVSGAAIISGNLTTGVLSTGGFALTGNGAASGRVLTAIDANGNATWQLPSGGVAGGGTIGRLAKFTGTTTLGDSLFTESGTNIGLGTGSPTSQLQIIGTQPTVVATNGTAATGALNVAGGKGGDTAGVTGQVGGLGAGITLTAGAGGNAPGGSTNGSGGSITLQPGAAGIGAGLAGTAGSVLLGPTGGRVGIGTAAPSQALHVVGNVFTTGTVTALGLSCNNCIGSGQIDDNVDLSDGGTINGSVDVNGNVAINSASLDVGGTVFASAFDGNGSALNSVTASGLSCADCVGSIEIASSAVSSSELASGAVTSNKIALGAVGSNQIAGGAVGSSQIAFGAVGSNQIAFGAVGSNQIAAGAVGSSQIAFGAVGSTQIAAGAVGDTQLSSNISPSKISGTAATLSAANTFTANQIIQGDGSLVPSVVNLAVRNNLDTGGSIRVGAYSVTTGVSRRIYFGDWQYAYIGENINYDDGLEIRAGDFDSIFLNSGTVGIGTDLPATKLQVIGDIRVGDGGTNGCVQNFAGAPLTGACVSDARFKKEIRPLGSLLDRVAKLEPVSYRWRVEEFPKKQFGPERVNGLIAQQVEEVMPELVSTDEDGYRRVNYSELPLLAIQSIKELKERNDALQQELEQMRQMLGEVQQRLGMGKQLSQMR